MASVARRVWNAVAERRTVPRDELRLEITLRGLDEGRTIPAAITNLSPAGFLAEIPAGVTLPEFLAADMPNSNSRKVQVVWSSGTLAGCNFLTPLGRADISAARLKSEPPSQSWTTRAAPGLDPEDPIWDMSSEATSEEKWPLRYRVLLIAAAGALPCLAVGAVATLRA